MYKAIINIGDYKKGQEVPTDLAETWLKMYKYPPVEKSTEEEKVEEMPEEITEGSDSILEDYLGRNERVVKKNLKEDFLSKSQLNKLLVLEKSDKSRKAVIKSIKTRLKK